MNIYSPVFSSSQVAHAAGMTASNFRAHLSRGNWRIIGAAQPADAFGKGHLFTIYDAVGFALAHQLVTRGVEPKLAFDLAMSDFAHASAGPAPGSKATRDPGGVFDRSHGFTLYVYCPGASHGQCVATREIKDPVDLIISPENSVASSAIIINLNDLRSRVFNALGLEERDYD